MGWVPGQDNNVEASVVWDTTEDAIAWTPPSFTGIVHKAFYVRAGQVVNLTIPIKSSVAISRDGFNVKLHQHRGSDLPDGKTHVSVQPSYSLVQAADVTNSVETNMDLTTDWQNVVDIGGQVFEFSGWVSIGITADGTFLGSQNPTIYVKDPVINVTGASKLDMITMQYVLA